MDKDAGGLLPPNVDAERLSWPQRIVVLEGTVGIVAPIVLGDEKKDGTRTPGLRERLHRVERLIVVGGMVSIALTFIQTFGFAEAIKHVFVTMLGGH